MKKCTKTSPTEDSLHSFSAEEICKIRVLLSAWYNLNKRDMPWRNYRQSNTDVSTNQHAYAVWVSEIMLQQTQVTTVIPYYLKWMELWPNIEALSGATEERVREMWSGLGYYTRAKNLLEGARFVMEKLHGEIPKKSSDLKKLIPGIGPYTAAAIASIVFGESVGVVDGNVLRVISRVRAIGAEVTSSQVKNVIQELVDKLVDPVNPGDSNQAIMELGATVCTPKTPNCTNCPLNSECTAYRVLSQKETQGKLCTVETKPRLIKHKIEFPCQKSCVLCLQKDSDWDQGLGVLNFPRKGKKIEVKKESFLVCVCEVVVKKSDVCKYLLVKRPSHGLLASFWEFPSLPVGTCEDRESTSLENEILSEFMNASALFQDCIPQYKGSVTHVFSHLSHNYSIYLIRSEISADESYENISDCFKNIFPNREIKWASIEEVADSAISTGMKKVLKVAQSREEEEKPRSKKRDGRLLEDIPSKRQSTLSQFISSKNIA